MSLNANHTDVISPLHQAARAYADNGVAIFPCRPNDKRPLGGHGFKDATTDPDQIDQWWTDTPDANIGIALGANNVFALDVDGPDGRATLDQLETEHGPLPPTYQVVTGRAEGSGRHHVYLQPTNSPAVRNHQIGNHLETRGDGGYIVAPPSIHPSGRPYMAMGRWADIVQPPQWLIDLTYKPAPTNPTPGPVDTTSPALRRLEAVCAKVVMAPEGTRNNILNWASYRAGQSVGAQQLDPDSAADMLLVAAQRAGLAIDEAAATIQSGMTAGAADPDTPDLAATGHDTPTVTTLGPDWAQPAPDDTSSPTRGAWAPADLTTILDGTYQPPQTTVLTRTDGFALLYPATTNAIFGESESGKSWVALHACAQQILAGNHVLYIDFEATAAVIAIRLSMLGVPTDAILAQFHYIAPDAPLNQDATDLLRQLITHRQPTIAVLDGVTGAMGLHGWNPLDNADAEQFDRLIPRAIANSGPAVLMVDHVPKSKEADAKYAMGAQHKRAAISGAAYRVDTISPLAPGNHGRLKVSISKDRHGTVRGQHSTQAGIFHLDSTDPDQPRAHIDAPVDQSSWKPTAYMEKVSRCLEDSPDRLSQRDIEALVGGRQKYVRDALSELVADGYVTRIQDGRTYLHEPVRPYRDPEAK